MAFVYPPYRLMPIEARQRLVYYFTEEGYKFFQDLNTDNCLIQSLISLMQFEDDNLRFISCKLLFAIFHAEKALFAGAESSYLFTAASYYTHSMMVNLATFARPEMVLLRMLQGYAESGEPHK